MPYIAQSFFHEVASLLQLTFDGFESVAKHAQSLSTMGRLLLDIGQCRILSVKELPPQANGSLACG